MIGKLRIALFGFVVLVAMFGVSCGSSGDEETVTDEELSETVGIDDGLPLADDEADSVGDESPCVEGEPDCEDVIAGDTQAEDLPDSSDDDQSVAGSGMTVDGGLSIAEALAGDTTGVLAIRGHLFDDGSGLRLCERLVGAGERYACDGRWVDVTNVDSDAVPDIVFLEGTTYTENEITLFGELIDGVLVVDPLVTG
jgi:hypothetical protein